MNENNERWEAVKEDAEEYLILDESTIKQADRDMQIDQWRKEDYRGTG